MQLDTKIRKGLGQGAPSGATGVGGGTRWIGLHAIVGEAGSLTCPFVEGRIAYTDPALEPGSADGDLRFLLLSLGVVDGVGLLISWFEDADLGLVAARQPLADEVGALRNEHGNHMGQG